MFAYFATDYNIECSLTAFLVVSIIVCRYFSPLRLCLLVFGPWIWLIGESSMACASGCCNFSAFRISNRRYNKNTEHTSHIRVFAMHKFEKRLFLKTNATNAVELARMRRFIIIILLNFLFMPCRSLRMHALIHKIHNAI